MITDKFWENLGGGLSGLWNVRVLTSAFAFWGALLLSWVMRGSQWCVLQKQLEEIYKNPAIGVTWIIGLLFLLLITEGIIAWITLPVLQFAEGYWGFPLRWLRKWMTDSVNTKYGKNRKEFNELYDKYRAWKADPENQPELDAAEFEKLGKLDGFINSHPLSENLRLPTRLGNILRSAEEFPWQSYKLEITRTWYSLWLVLPEVTRQELSSARQALNERTQLMTYGIIYTLVGLGMLVLGKGAWWAPLIGLVIILVSYYVGMLPASKTYGELIRAAYAVHRFGLYMALGWELPIDDARERIAGEQINLYLSTGIVPKGFYFKHGKPD